MTKLLIANPFPHKIIGKALIAGALMLGAIVLGHEVMAQSPTKMKEGLWLIKTVSTGSKTPRLMKMCTDQATQDRLTQMGTSMAKNMCTMGPVKRSGNKMDSSATCKMGKTTISSLSHFEFNGSTAYKGVTRSVYSPALMGLKESTSTVEGTWSGACPAGMKPGEVDMGLGDKRSANINVNEMMAKLKARQ